MKPLPCLLFRSPGPHKMPGLNPPTYDYIGAATEEEYHRHIANGWVESRDEAIGHTSPKPLAAFDHDGDGKPGGSVAQSGDDVKALREQYEIKFGKRPFNGWGADKLREKLEGDT